MARRAFTVACLALLALTRIAACADLRSIDTAHYRIYTDLDAALSHDLALRMEAMYREYQSRLSDFSIASSPRLDVYLFRDRADYLNLVGTDMTNTGGAFVPRRNLLAAFLEGQGRDALRRTLQHEAFHQFASVAIGGRLPVWLNEGVAQVFEEGVWTGHQFAIGQVPPRRIRQLNWLLDGNRTTSFRTFLALTERQWREDLRDEAVAGARYTQAWAMAHFLIYAPNEDGSPRYRGRLIEMLRNLRRGVKPDQAFSDAFSPNVDGFEARFLEYARPLQPTALATFIDRQQTLADFAIMLQQQGTKTEDLAALRDQVCKTNARVRYTQGTLEWMTATDPSVYFRDEANRTYTREQLYFSPRGGAPLPDLICSPAPGITLRTIFRDGRERIKHETITEGH